MPRQRAQRRESAVNAPLLQRPTGAPTARRSRSTAGRAHRRQHGQRSRTQRATTTCRRGLRGAASARRLRHRLVRESLAAPLRNQRPRQRDMTGNVFGATLIRRGTATLHQHHRLNCARLLALRLHAVGVVRQPAWLLRLLNQMREQPPRVADVHRFAAAAPFVEHALTLLVRQSSEALCHRRALILPDAHGPRQHWRPLHPLTIFILCKPARRAIPHRLRITAALL
uniref:Uncharacterized protein n=1 Tax=Ralstonia solanacearum TaxID=305 RepID=A0A0S4UTE0_RALSL|nr:protein of unknown function [Ralstonia solanacearum]CUV33017.1 protein of unknown function [Ralstonia solanacearum]CUV41762.1 protein of unknown function [Ralstonia solanacearum]CUV58901.1 protein of unknown function [Ralstonia solanacearum]